MAGPILQYLLSREPELGPLSVHAAEGPWRHWRMAGDEEGVVWLLLDRADSPVNALSEAVLTELDEILQQLAEKPPRGLVLRSAKPSGFCVGADVEELRGLDDRSAIVDKLGAAHQVANRLEALDCPTLAIVHGPCLGGGLELVLCCDYCLALPDAKLGLPEIRLGLHPGLGGTARLTHQIDPLEAMKLMLTGKTLDATRAKKAGIVDRIVEERHIRRAVTALVSGDVEVHNASLRERLLTTAPARQVEARQMRAKSAEKADPKHYPAPEALIALWETHGGDEQRMRQAEIRSFAELLSGATARNLLRVFFLSERMKRSAKSDTRPLRHLHVVGAGAMGAEIAGWCALQGLHVSLYDPRIEALAEAVKTTAALCRSRHRSASETRKVLDRLIPDRDNRGVGHADLVIEAVPEKIELKQQIYAEIEPRMRPDALLATNTSSIPLEQLAEGLERPGRFVGLHFFNPVAKMQLVEVVAQDAVDPAALDRARAFVGAIQRLPATVTSAPGFLVNRVLMPYLLEAIVLLDEGVGAEAIDRVAESFGMPMGPVELADYVGLDICLGVAEMLQARLEQPMAPLPDWFRDKVEQGELGKKSGQGFYRWKGGKADKSARSEGDQPDLDRLLLPMLNGCMTCLREGVIADADLLDGAMIFGTGFAPFRGGPLHYARQRGFAEIASALERLADRWGERFTPDPGWYD